MKHMLLFLSRNLKPAFAGLAFFVALLASIEVGAQAQLTVTVDSSTPSCTDDGTAAISIAGGVGPYTAYWIQYNQNPNGGGPDTVATGLTVSNLAPGYYYIVVNDSTTPTTLSGYASVYIQPAFNLSQQITPATCANADGKIVLSVFSDSSGTQSIAPYDFEWSNGINHIGLAEGVDSITGIPAGNYSVLVRDGNGCFVNGGATSAGTIDQGLTVWSNSPITTTNAVMPSNCFDGSATVTPANGTAPYAIVWNTVPAQIGPTATGLSPGNYVATVTDAVGCTRLAYVNVPAGPNYLQVTSQIAHATCADANGAINITVTGGDGTYSYTWSNGATTQDLSGLVAGSYTVVVADGAGCTITAYKYVQSSSPINVNIIATAPSCGGVDGELVAQVTGGSAPYTFVWSGNITTQNLSNIGPGSYYVTVTDGNGCTGSDWYWLDESQSCKIMISGRVYNDLNGNCVQDNGEGALSNVMVNASPGYHYASTDNNGYYSILADAGTYDVTAYSPTFWDQVCPTAPQAINIVATTPGGVFNGNNFFLQPDSVFNDLRVYVYSGPARPGFPMTWYVNVHNAGTTALAPVLAFEHDALLSYSSSSPSGNYTSATNTLTWNVPLMAPQSSRTFYVYGTLSTAAVIGNYTTGIADVTIAGVDVTPADNSDVHEALITGSYDPNDKAVEPAGLGEDGLITAQDTLLHYLIRFQNTGTDTAFTVVIRDTLDPALDVTSFRLDGYSHSMEYSITGEGIVAFTFNNILLPDSFRNEPRSHGYVSYFIERKMDIDFGTRIENTAHIYFDFNLPIVTNTTVNTLFDPTVGITPVYGFNLALQPNPSSDLSMLQLSLKKGTDVNYSIQDLSGRIIQQRSAGFMAAGEHFIPISRQQLGLSEGIYLIRVDAGTQSMTKKWILVK